jgi:hypothetical protein
LKKPLRIELAIAALLLAPFVGYAIAFLVSNAEGAQRQIDTVAVGGAPSYGAASNREAGA